VIYVVSGYRRSGTSMMMRILGESDIEVIYQPAQETLHQVAPATSEHDSYDPHPSKLWEAGQGWYMRPNFGRMINDEQNNPGAKSPAIKILFDGLPHLPKGEWKVIFLLRDIEEIDASTKFLDRHLRRTGVKENGMLHYPFDCFRPYDQDDIDHVLGICDARADIELIKLQFRDIVEDPEKIKNILFPEE
jgi:hypothetical protein